MRKRNMFEKKNETYHEEKYLQTYFEKQFIVTSCYLLIYITKI